MIYDLVIIGGGPAGVAAGIYAGRKKIKTLFITDFFGGQSIVSNNIQNWIGFKSITGFEFAQILEDHLRTQEDLEIIDNDLVIKIQKKENQGNLFPIFILETQKGKIFETKTILIATGSRRRKLNVPGEKEFEGKGVFYCATCDAPLMKDKKAAVIGGGNAGLEAVIDLLPYAQKIYLLEIGEKLKGDQITQDKIKNQQKVEIILKAQTKEIFGSESGFVKGLRYFDLKNQEFKELEVDGVFIEIGSLPNSEIVKDLVNLNQFGEIIVDPKTQATSCPGIWAAGDVTDGLYKQNNIAAGDAIKAVLNIAEFLQKIQ